MPSIDETTNRQAAVTAALLDDLRTALDLAELSYATPPAPIGGGFWADIFAIRLTGAPPHLGGDLVARIMPDAALGRRETIVQREVAEQGFPAPAVRLAADGAALGRTFMVMDRAAGAPLLSGLTARSAVVSLPRVLRRLPRLLASTALDLHLLDPSPVIEGLRDADIDASIDTADMVANLRRAATELGSPALVHANDWLTANLPEPERVSVCHGDLHPFNLLVDADDHVTLVDWTASRVSEPAFDLAFTTLMIRAAPLDVPALLQPPLRRAARWLAGDVVRTYRDLARGHGIVVDDDRLAWHTALQCTRILTEVGSWHQADQPDHPFRAMADDLRAQLAATVGAS